MNVTECLEKIVDISKQNLDLLKLLNDSFYSKASHSSININGKDYKVPSFLTLENKLNFLQSSWNNLIQITRWGDATYNDGTGTKRLLLTGYDNFPEPLKIAGDNIISFDVNDKNPLLDILYPTTSFKIELEVVPYNISKVLVRKYRLYNDFLTNTLERQAETSKKIEFQKFKEFISTYEKPQDYDYYDTILDLGTYNNTHFGEWTISEILSDEVDDKLDNIIKLTTNEQLSYTKNHIEVEFLKVGDIITNYDSTLELEIIDIRNTYNELTLLVKNGGYSHLQNEGDYAKLRLLHRTPAIDNKTIDIPLEEDRFIYVAVAPINSITNTAGLFKDGLFIDTYNLLKDNENYHKFYTNNVINIGDILNEITSLYGHPITNLTNLDILKTKPKLKESNFVVVPINKHLNNSKNIENIRSLYQQKANLKVDLLDVQRELLSCQTELNIGNTENQQKKSELRIQINDLNSKQYELLQNINNISQKISDNSNNSLFPIQDLKYRIRGYFDVNEYLENLQDVVISDVDHIEVLYRYKNYEQPSLTSSNSIGDFNFSEWVKMPIILRSKEFGYQPGLGYNIKYDNEVEGSFDNTSNNEKFNQIEIPITQGEVVDIKVRVFWSFGSPFGYISSDYSEPLTIKFPEIYNETVEVLDIIKENNKDIEDYKMRNLLITEGISEHCSSKIEDSSNKFWHSTRDIASGFTNDNLQNIPLYDLLQEMRQAMSNWNEYIDNMSNENLIISFNSNTFNTRLDNMKVNIIGLPAFNNVPEGQVNSGDCYKKDGVAVFEGYITIENKSKYNTYLYSLFPGQKEQPLQDNKNFNSELGEQLFSKLNDIPIYDYNGGDSYEYYQTPNQPIYFTKNNLFGRYPLNSYTSIDMTNFIGAINTNRYDTIDFGKNTGGSVQSIPNNDFISFLDNRRGSKLISFVQDIIRVWGYKSEQNYTEELEYLEKVIWALCYIPETQSDPYISNFYTSWKDLSVADYVLLFNKALNIRFEPHNTINVSTTTLNQINLRFSNWKNTEKTLHKYNLEQHRNGLGEWQALFTVLSGDSNFINDYMLIGGYEAGMFCSPFDVGDTFSFSSIDTSIRYKFGDIVAIPGFYNEEYMKVNDQNYAYKLYPGDSLTYPIKVLYKCSDKSENVKFRLGFVIKSSIIGDPKYYDLDFRGNLYKDIKTEINNSYVNTKYETLV